MCVIEEVAPRVLCVECARNIGEEDNGELQPFAPVDRHDAHDILTLAEGSGNGEIRAAAFQCVDVAQEAEESALVRPFEVGGTVDEHAQVRLTQRAPGERADIVIVSCLTIERPEQFGNAVRQRMAAPAANALQCVLSHLVPRRAREHVVDAAVRRAYAQLHHLRHREPNHR